MAVIKKKTRKRITKELSRLIKKHGPEMTLALVTGIISAVASERSNKAAAKAARQAKAAKSDQPSKAGTKKAAPKKRARRTRRAAA